MAIKCQSTRLSPSAASRYVRVLIIFRKILQTVMTPFAVLDIHFAPIGQSQSLFGVASSTGSIGLYRLIDQHRSDALDQTTAHLATPQVVHVQTINVTDPSILVTAFVWHPKASGPGVGRTSLVACLSLTDGTIAMEEIPVDPKSSTTRISTSIGCHDLEAWTVALTPDGQGIYSGGDDSVLAFWDVVKYSAEIGLDAPSLDVAEKSEWKDRKLHGAGHSYTPTQNNRIRNTCADWKL